MKCYRKNGSDLDVVVRLLAAEVPSMKCYRKNGSDDHAHLQPALGAGHPSMKCYRKNGSDSMTAEAGAAGRSPSMKCYRKNGSDSSGAAPLRAAEPLNEVLPKER